MRFYCQFFENEKEALGSDGIFILDGRNSVNTMIFDCKKQLLRMQNIHKDYNGFEIRRTVSGRLTDYIVTWSEKIKGE